MPNKFSKRSEEIEIMDDLDAGGELMDQTLRELEIINKWLGGNYVTLNGLNKLIAEDQKPEKLKIVDLGCGGGDMLKLVAKWAKKKGISVELIGVDANPHVVKFAKENTKQFPEISYRVVNIFSDTFKALKPDIFIATLFTHHFTDSELTNLLNQLNDQAKKGIIINDIHRHCLAYHSINLLTRLFSKSPMVKNDAALSVLRSFKKKEIVEILKATESKKFTIKWMWAFRWQVVLFVQ